MKVIIWTPGKIKERWLKEGEEKYRKLISRYLKIENVEVKESSGSPELMKKKDAEKAKEFLLKQKRSLKYLLDEKGEFLTTVDFARLIEMGMRSGKDVIFIIGGPFGFEDSFKKSSLFDKMIAVSRMTFSHEMMRVILMEQIFRSLKIIKGERYHY